MGKIKFRVQNKTLTFANFVVSLKSNCLGVTVKLIHTPGESNDLTTLWFPDWRVVMPIDNIYDYFPNIYPIRGSPLRDCQAWYKSLDKVRHLRAEYLVSGHMLPLYGEDHIFNVVTRYRDAMQFVFDQTIRWMNKGLDVDEIVEKVRLPSSLASDPFLRQHYGKVSWAVKSVFNGQLGWFGGNPAYLNPLSRQKRAEKIAKLVGTNNFPAFSSGQERMLHHAKETFQKSELHFSQTGEISVDDVQWSLELATDTMKASDASSTLHMEAKKVAASAMKMLAKGTLNFPERNYYSTYAAELNLDFVIALSDEDKHIAITTSKLVDIMRRFQYRFMAESCDSNDLLKVIFDFFDVNETYAYIMRNCILEFIVDEAMIPKDFDVKLTLTSATWKNIITGKKNAVIALATGDIAVQGSIMSFKRFSELLDKN